MAPMRATSAAGDWCGLTNLGWQLNWHAISTANRRVDLDALYRAVPTAGARMGNSARDEDHVVFVEDVSLAIDDHLQGALKNEHDVVSALVQVVDALLSGAYVEADQINRRYVLGALHQHSMCPTRLGIERSDRRGLQISHMHSR